ncbi:hypothetical protein [Nonomuraea sp. NPDC050643]
MSTSDVRLFGLADTHVHFAAHEGFGGYGVFGDPLGPSRTARPGTGRPA